MVNRGLYMGCFVLCCAVSAGCGDSTSSEPETVNLCGNGVLDTASGEVCDGVLGIPDKCELYDASKTWAAGGKPACSSDCRVITAGTCTAVSSCGNGSLDSGEICDGSAGVPESCEALDSKKQWVAGGRPACSLDCQSVTIGTCREVDAICGDGIVNNNEVCDGTSGVPATCAQYNDKIEWKPGGAPACRDDCMFITHGTCVANTSFCGDGVMDDDELCDESDGVPESCSEYDGTRKWEPGGKPSCSSTCETEKGTCIEAYCGNGILGEDEICDGELGLPETCDAYRSDKEWKAGGRPGCSENCKKITQGSCVEVQKSSLTFMNWNVEVDYDNWGGSPVPPRAEKLYNAMKSWSQIPDIFAIIEVSPNWHAQSKYFEDMGYAWADAPIKETWWDFSYAGYTCGDNNENAFLETTTRDQAASCFLFTDILYQKDKFELVEADYVKLFPPTDWDGLPADCTLHIRGDICSTYDPESLYCNNKTIAFAALLREKSTGAEFIAVSTHWNPNNGVNTSDIPGGIIGPVADNELVRAYGAGQMATLIASFKNKYPNAYIIAGGDFNTIDFSIIYNSEEATSAIELLTPTGEITDAPTMIKAFNSLMTGKYAADRLPLDFPGSHAKFKELSGLKDARSEALANIPKTVDSSTTQDENIVTYTDAFKIKVVIDYTFYSPELELTSYRVVNDKELQGVSDHFPVMTQYKYELP